MKIRTYGVLVASALAVAAAPSLAAAQSRCEAEAHDKKVEGTVVGGLLGAGLGAAVSGGRAGGAIIGGVAGAAIGNNVSRTHCPAGYAEVSDPNYMPPPPPPGDGPPPPPAYGDNGFWHGAPQGVEQRIDWFQARIDRNRDSGRLDPRQVGYAQHDLDDIRRMDGDLRQRDGGNLSDPDRSYVQSRLDTLGQNLHWMRVDNNGG